MHERNNNYIIDDPQLMLEWDSKKNGEMNIYPEKLSVGSHKTAYCYNLQSKKLLMWWYLYILNK